MDAAQGRTAESTAADEPRAPALPIERPIVAAVRALEAVKAQVERALLQLEWSPRDEAEVFGALSGLNASANTAWHAYAAYSEIRKCQGQA